MSIKNQTILRPDQTNKLVFQFTAAPAENPTISITNVVGSSADNLTQSNLTFDATAKTGSVDIAVGEDAVCGDRVVIRAISNGEIVGTDATIYEAGKSGAGSLVPPNQGGGGSLTPGSVSTQYLANDAVTNAKLADNAVARENIVDSAVDQTKLAPNSVGASEMQDNAIGLPELNAGSGSAGQVLARTDANNAMEWVDQASGGGGSPTIPDGSLNTIKFADSSITNAKIADDAVTASKIAANAVGASEIASGSVDTDELADDAVTNAKVASGAIGTTELADNAVTTAKVTDGSITQAKLDSNIEGIGNTGGISYLYSTQLVTSTATGKIEAPDADNSISSPDRLITATQTGSTGIDGQTLLTVLDTSAISPQFGGDLIRGPFFADYEGSILFDVTSSFQATDIHQPLFVIRTTHKIPGQTDVVSTRVVEGSIFSGQGLASINLGEFNARTLLASDITNGGKIGMKIEIGVVFFLQSSQTQITDFINQVQQNNSITGTNRPTQNVSYTATFHNTRATFYQSTYKSGVTAGLTDGEVATAKIADGAVTAPKIANGAIDTNKIADGEVKTDNIDSGAITAAKLANYLGITTWTDAKAIGSVIPENTLILYQHRLYIVKQDIAVTNAVIRATTPDDVDGAASYFESTHLDDTQFEVSSGERHYTFGLKNNGDAREVVLGINLDVNNDNAISTFVIDETGISLYKQVNSTTSVDTTDSSTYTKNDIVIFENDQAISELVIEELHQTERTGYQAVSSGTVNGGIIYQNSGKTLVIHPVTGDSRFIEALLQPHRELRIESTATQSANGAGEYIDGVIRSIQETAGLVVATFRDEGFTFNLNASNSFTTTNSELKIISKTAVQYLDSPVYGSLIVDGSIATAKLADDAITSAKLGAGAVDNTALASNAVDLSNLNAGTGTAGQVLARNTANDGIDWIDAASGGGGATVLTNLSYTNLNALSAGEPFVFSSSATNRPSHTARNLTASTSRGIKLSSTELQVIEASNRRVWDGVLDTTNSTVTWSINETGMIFTESTYEFEAGSQTQSYNGPRRLWLSGGNDQSSPNNIPAQIWFEVGDRFETGIQGTLWSGTPSSTQNYMWWSCDLFYRRRTTHNGSWSSWAAWHPNNWGGSSASRECFFQSQVVTGTDTSLPILHINQIPSSRGAGFYQFGWRIDNTNSSMQAPRNYLFKATSTTQRFVA